MTSYKNITGVDIYILHAWMQEPTEIVQVLPTSTDHSQVSIDVSFDASNDDVDENLKLQHEIVTKIVKSVDLNSL